MDRYANLSDDGEVDHSFFDSDDDGEKGKVATTSSTSKNEYKQKQHDSGSEEREDDAEQRTSKVESEEESKASIDRSSPEHTSSPGPMRPKSAAHSGRGSMQSLKIEATIPTGIPQIRREFEDNYYPDEEDSSEEESRSSRPKTAKQTNIGKKNAAKYSRDFPSSISSSDTEFSDAHSDDQTSKAYQSLRDKVPFSLGSPARKAARPPIRDYVDESEDTITDVTPLSTPDISPISSFDLAATSEALKNKVKRQENVSQEIYGKSFA